MTKQKVGEEVRKLVKSWNAEYAEKPNVSQQQKQLFFSWHWYRLFFEEQLKNIFLSSLQPHHDRSSFSKYEILASHELKDKDDRSIHSQIVLSISNWHFNRDKQYLKFGPTCRAEDVCVSIKLSSSAFLSVAEAGPTTINLSDEGANQEASDDVSVTAAPAVGTDDSVFNFDKNGVIIPYSAFVSLMDDENFQKYLKLVVSKFEETEGPIAKLFLDVNGEEENEEEELNRSVSSLFNKKYQRKNPILYEEEEEEEGEEDEETAYLKKKRPNTPMANEDFASPPLPESVIEKNSGKKAVRKTKKWPIQDSETSDTEPFSYSAGNRRPL